MLLWICNCPNPRQLRDRVLNDESFKHALLCWLESCHTGQYSTGTENDIRTHIDTLRRRRFEQEAIEGTYRDPATTLPRRPPMNRDCNEAEQWFEAVCAETDEIVYLSNRHDRKHRKGCLKGNPPSCKARFPRETRSDTIVESDTGAIRFRKLEPWINTYNIVLSYLMRCNTDVTCLLSGTQVRAVVAYVTDYVTKTPLKTYQIFEAVKAFRQGRGSETAYG
ncbi:hypothetical protein C8Q73DRAFT_743561 [Cubamyces lactineus]|nr:hypothetical protein C8Q73DRAFT_743561 [Cubamyces lactineus]